MSAVASTLSPPLASEQHIVLEGIDWALYNALRELPENQRKRMIYDRGLLEIMTLSSFHERIAGLIARFIDEWTIAHDIAMISCGSMTFQRSDLARGLEPDQCYYISHEQAVRHRQHIDLTIDPAPDLVIEVDYTSASIDKMSIYHAMGVAEVWRWHEERVQVYRFTSDQYIESDTSVCLAGFPFEQLHHALSQRHDINETALIRQFRNYLENNPITTITTNEE